MDPIEVFTVQIPGEPAYFLAYLGSSPAEVVRASTEAAAAISVLEKQGLIVRHRIRHEPEPEAVQVSLQPAKLEGLTLQQAQEHAKKGARITRAGCENFWCLMLIPAFAPSWAKFVMGLEGNYLPPVRWPRKAPRHHQETAADVYATDWKVIADDRP